MITPVPAEQPQLYAHQPKQPEVVKENLDVQPEDLRYGCFNVRPSWLQWLNKIQWAVVWVSVANGALNMVDGMLGVVLSTLEKRYDLASSQSAWIAAAFQLGPVPILLLIAYFGNRIHRPLSMAWGMLVMCLGCCVSFLPQFLAPPYDPRELADNQTTQLCAATPSQTCSDSQDLSYYLPVFIIGRIMIGMGATPVLSVGITYMDDCSTKQKISTYIGIYNAMSVIGPVFSYIGGGLLLNIYVDFYITKKDEIGLDPSDSRWVGAWWLSYILAAILCLIISIPLFGYQRDLPGASEIRRAKISEAHNDIITGENLAEIQFIKSWAEFKVLCKDVFSNLPYLLLTVFIVCDMFIISGFTSFGPKFFQFSFNMTASFAGVLFGVVLLPAGAGGTIAGGMFVEKTKIPCSKIIQIEAVLGLITLGLMALLLITCPQLPFVGVNTPYNASDTGGTLGLESACNADCGCSSATYEPVCSYDNRLFFSPCHAACYEFRRRDKIIDYSNCSCINNQNSNRTILATSETCSQESCPASAVFLAFFFLANVFIFACLTLNTSATLRCVTSGQTSFAIGIQMLLIKIFGMFPGPLLLGLAFDASCAIWLNDDCGEQTSCLSYDPSRLSKNFFYICFSVKFIGSAAIVTAALVYKPPRSAPQVLDVQICDASDLVTKEGVDEDVSYYPSETKMDGVLYPDDVDSSSLDNEAFRGDHSVLSDKL